MNYYLDLAETLRVLASRGENTKLYRRQLHSVTMHRFNSKIASNEQKIKFWTDIYRAYLHILKDENVDEEEMFTKKRIKFAYNSLSLNDIEYGILRKKKTFKFVQVRMPIFNSFIRQLALENTNSASNLKLIKEISSPSLNQKINHPKTLNFININ